MSPGRFWIALVDVHPDTPQNREWLAFFGEHAGGAFVHAMGMADNPPAFQQAVTESLAGYGWIAAAFDDLELFSACKSRGPLSPALEQMEKALMETGDLQFGLFFLYPHEETSPPEWLAREAEDRRLTLTQSRVLAGLSRMLQQLPLPKLAEGIGLTRQGSDRVEIHLPHRDESELGVTVLVRLDEEITVDYGYGHVHFTSELGADWVGQALEFLYGALQGGVKVEIWASGDKLEQSRALILLENGEWYPFALWSSTPEPVPSGEPSLVKFLSFL